MPIATATLYADTVWVQLNQDASRYFNIMRLFLVMLPARSAIGQLSHAVPDVGRPGAPWRSARAARLCRWGSLVAAAGPVAWHAGPPGQIGFIDGNPVDPIGIDLPDIVAAIPPGDRRRRLLDGDPRRLCAARADPGSPDLRDRVPLGADAFGNPLGAAVGRTGRRALRGYGGARLPGRRAALVWICPPAASTSCASSDGHEARRALHGAVRHPTRQMGRFDRLRLAPEGRSPASGGVASATAGPGRLGPTGRPPPTVISRPARPFWRTVDRQGIRSVSCRFEDEVRLAFAGHRSRDLKMYAAGVRRTARRLTHRMDAPA